jgi:hypothetical protein
MEFGEIVPVVRTFIVQGVSRFLWDYGDRFYVDASAVEVMVASANFDEVRSAFASRERGPEDVRYATYKTLELGASAHPAATPVEPMLLTAKDIEDFLRDHCHFWPLC